MKSIEELIDHHEPGWDVVMEWLNRSCNHYEILPRDKARAETELLNAQISTRSTMGAIIYETGGILIDHGWIRILGSGSTSKFDRGLMEWNKGKTMRDFGEKPSFLLIADDAIGGYFAINAGGIGSEIGSVYYLAQDTLEWESLGCGYSDFINWTLTGDIQKFYELFRWKNWKADLETINCDQTFSFFPFLWSHYDDFEQLSKKIIPTQESYNLTLQLQKVRARK